MATTSLWHIKGRLKDLIDYVENPAKTETAPAMQDFFNVFSYAQNPEKTEHGEYVTAINCLKEIALQQMILTKKQFGKDDGYIAWHGYQSFKPGEVDAQTCHAIGVQTAKELWGSDFQIIVTTHLDKGHLHNHFCFNSVGFRDGRKFNYSKAERQRMMEVSDRICLEHGLSVIRKPHKAPSRPVWEDEKKGKPTRYNIYREDIQDAMYGSDRLDLMIRYLERLGYDVDFSGPKWKIKLHKYRYYTHLETLNPEWTPEFIRENLGLEVFFGNHRAEVRFSPDLPDELRGTWQPGKRTTRIYRLYLYWQYQLGILPRGTDYRPTSPFMREELRKLDSMDAQVRYMATNKIETLDDLHTDREQTEMKLEELVRQRKKLENKIRRASPEAKEAYRQEKAQLATPIAELRKRRRMALAIEGRAKRIDASMELLMANEEREEQRIYHRQERSHVR